MSDSKGQKAANLTSVGAPPQTPLGELTAGFKGATSKGVIEGEGARGSGDEGRGEKGKEGKAGDSNGSFTTIRV